MGLIKPIPKKFNTSNIELLTKALIDKWVIRQMTWGERIYLDCMPPGDYKFITVSAGTTGELQDELNKLVEQHPELKSGKIYDKVQEFNDVLFARKDLLANKGEVAGAVL